MKKNEMFSQMMYEKYTLFSHSKVKIVLKDGYIICGYLLACYHDESDEVIAWDFLEEKFVEKELEVSIFTSDDDIRIEQEKIDEVYFFEDKSTIKF